MESDVGIVIDRTAVVETVIDQIILQYLSPRSGAEDFAQYVVLDSSILPLGSKLKIITVISQEIGFKIQKDALHKLISLRNAFAHQGLKAHGVENIKKRFDDGTHYTLQTITSGGKLKCVRRDEALAEFSQAFEQAIESLFDMRDKIGRSIS